MQKLLPNAIGDKPQNQQSGTIGLGIATISSGSYSAFGKSLRSTLSPQTEHYASH